MSEHRIKVSYLQYDRIMVSQEFIERNKLVLKTSKEARQKHTETRSEDVLNFIQEILIQFIAFEDIKDIIDPEHLPKIESGEEVWLEPLSLEEAVQDFLDYMVFAWGKALDERGISAGRSIQKLGTYLWLFSRPDLEELIKKDSLYYPYGRPALRKVCEELGIQTPNEL